MNNQMYAPVTKASMMCYVVGCKATVSINDTRRRDLLGRSVATGKL